MRANELKIGNLLYNDGVVVVIDARTIFDIWDDKGLKNYKPIPLTEEWLLKFGFEKFKFDVNETYQRTSDILFRKSIGDKSWLTIAHSDMPISFPMIKDEHQKAHYLLRGISNVHQLQNLYFALTGQELANKVLSKLI